MKPTLQQTRALPTFAETHLWNTHWATFPSAVSGPPESARLNRQAITTTMPKKVNVGNAETFIRGNKVTQPGSFVAGDPLTLTYVETVDALILDWIRKWRDALPTNDKPDLEGTLIMHLLNRRGNEYYEYVIPCFLTDYELVELTAGDATDTMKLQLLLNYDDFQEKAIAEGA